MVPLRMHMSVFLPPFNTVEGKKWFHGPVVFRKQTTTDKTPNNIAGENPALSAEGRHNTYIYASVISLSWQYSPRQP